MVVYKLYVSCTSKQEKVITTGSKQFAIKVSRWPGTGSKGRGNSARYDWSAGGNRKNYTVDINVDKSKVMRIPETEELLWVIMENQELEHADQFRYLGSSMTKIAFCIK